MMDRPALLRRRTRLLLPYPVCQAVARARDQGVAAVVSTTTSWDSSRSTPGVDPAEVSVECPEGQEAEEGNEFQCTLTAPNGDEVAVDVTITEGGDSFEAVVPPQQFE